jgi:3-oxoacyl-[acyl-carrier-protein] synthase III
LEAIQENRKDNQETSEKKKKKKKKRKVDKFTEMTDKIIEKKGLKPKDFDRQAIKEARQKLYDDFVKENISQLLD